MYKKRILSIRVEENVLKQLSNLAKKEKVSKASIINKALEAFFGQKEVEVEEVASMIKKVKELDNKYSTVINRINILMRQIEHLQKGNRHE